MTFQDWIDLFENQWFYEEWKHEFEEREAKELKENWFGVEDWLNSTIYTDFISYSFYYGEEQKWNKIEEEWRKAYEMFE